MLTMQFFTDEMFEAGTAHESYLRYWIANRKRLPNCILRINRGMLPDHFFTTLTDAIDLHDARLQTVNADLPNVALHFQGDNHGALRDIMLHYTGVTACTPIPHRLLADEPQSDLMCHETTIVEVNKFNHRMLFASSDIMSIDFTALGIESVDHPQPA